ncbi:MAG: hypothetical protein R3E68_16340 [Burkholderiaceae bacterium]
MPINGIITARPYSRLRRGRQQDERDRRHPVQETRERVPALDLDRCALVQLRVAEAIEYRWNSTISPSITAIDPAVVRHRPLRISPKVLAAVVDQHARIDTLDRRVALVAFAHRAPSRARVGLAVKALVDRLVARLLGDGLALARQQQAGEGQGKGQHQDGEHRTSKMASLRPAPALVALVMSIPCYRSVWIMTKRFLNTSSMAPPLVAASNGSTLPL